MRDRFRRVLILASSSSAADRRQASRPKLPSPSPSPRTCMPRNVVLMPHQPRDVSIILIGKQQRGNVARLRAGIIPCGAERMTGASKRVSCSPYHPFGHGGATAAILRKFRSTRCRFGLAQVPAALLGWRGRSSKSWWFSVFAGAVFAGPRDQCY